MPHQEEIAAALRSGHPVRLHLRDGEVVVARILQFDDQELHFVPITSSRPERYGVCDSTGFVRRISEVERAVVVEPPRARRHR